MKNLLYKELKTFVSPLNYLFFAFTLMAFIPGGYPLLVSTFFIMMGVFVSFQIAREHHDTLFTVLLPVKKTDAVKARYLTVTVIQLISLLLLGIFCAIRLTLLSDLPAYASPALMPANFTFLGFAFISFGLFNAIFLCGFYKTAYHYAKPFIIYIIVFFIVVIIEETLGFMPFTAFLKAQSGNDLLLQIPVLACGIVFYALATMLSLKSSEKKFSSLDI